MTLYEEMKAQGKQPFKAFIRVIKSYQSDYYNEKKEDETFIRDRIRFNTGSVVSERLIYATDKKEVKKILLEKYPQFFPDGKIFEKESKTNKFQIFYVLIYPLYDYEVNALNSGSWTCSGCGHVHENRYIHSPKTYGNIGENYLFCNPYHDGRDTSFSNDACLKLLKNKGNDGEQEPFDDLGYSQPDSVSYIYKITEKDTGKCYIGKTKNAPFFRWWQHLKHSPSPFGYRLRTTPISNWLFEVIEELPPILSNKEILEKESEYILRYDSINNGYNTLISNKSAECIENEDENENRDIMD